MKAVTAVGEWEVERVAWAIREAREARAARAAAEGEPRYEV